LQIGLDRHELVEQLGEHDLIALVVRGYDAIELVNDQSSHGLFNFGLARLRVHKILNEWL